MAMLVYQRVGFSKSFSIRPAFSLAGMRDMPGAGSKARCGCAAGSTRGTPRGVVAERLTGINLVQIIMHLVFFFNFPGNFFPEFRKSLHNMRIATCSKLQRKGLLDISWFAFKEVQVYLCAGIRKAWPANVSFVRFCRRAWRWVLQAVDRIYIRLH